ncbi:MAG: hypothetical protein M1834_005567 [Cirrosporium novae-zelandiae]|nr:MAG: hypothetical protein M1834_005567 [Cirrosporium novae-zelandiae]
MAPKYPSIESFMHPRPSPQKTTSPSTLTPGDGFTAEEIEMSLNPTTLPWNPNQEYDDTDIIDLTSGWKNVTFMGRVVNFHSFPIPDRGPQSAKGCTKIVVKDDTGIIVVKLLYAHEAFGSNRPLTLGYLVSIWTTRIENEHNPGNVQEKFLSTTIFPERDRTCYFMIQDQSDGKVLCKSPLEYTENRPLAGLMTLKNFKEGGHEVPEVKVLVCIKSIGVKKTISTRNGTSFDKIDLLVFDDTSTATLSLYNDKIASSLSWQPSVTTLLITKPHSRMDFKEGIELSIKSYTRVDIDPDFVDAQWLRSYAQRLTKRQHINPPFQEGVFDLDQFEMAESKLLFRLSDIDSFVRSKPNEIYMGYLSILITELNLVTLSIDGRLLCNECCGMPIYANATSAKCKTCNTEVSLRINPRLNTHLNNNKQIGRNDTRRNRLHLARKVYLVPNSLGTTSREN